MKKLEFEPITNKIAGYQQNRLKTCQKWRTICKKKKKKNCQENIIQQN